MVSDDACSRITGLMIRCTHGKSRAFLDEREAKRLQTAKEDR